MSYGPRPRPLLERFMKYVSPEPMSGCWLWTGALDDKGYGRLGVNRSAQRAHRVAYELFVGPIPDLPGYHGGCLLHRCDNPACVNPQHLVVGTQQDNIADRERKGRHRVAPRLAA
jgi:hypothetical protein